MKSEIFMRVYICSSRNCFLFSSPGHSSVEFSCTIKVAMKGAVFFLCFFLFLPANKCLSLKSSSFHGGSSFFATYVTGFFSDVWHKKSNFKHLLPLQRCMEILDHTSASSKAAMNLNNPGLNPQSLITLNTHGQ